MAWLKLQYFCHAGDTEIGGFGIGAVDDVLYIREFRTVRQAAGPVTVAFDDAAVADFFDACADGGLAPGQYGKIWLHTHPGESPAPSFTDERTFASAFGRCDWAVMFILGRTGRTHARLTFGAGPGGALELPVVVDWAAWPKELAGGRYDLAEPLRQWESEFAAHIHPTPASTFPRDRADLDVANDVQSLLAAMRGEEDLWEVEGSADSPNAKEHFDDDRF